VRSSAIAGALAFGLSIVAANDARAQGLDADAVLNKMTSEQQTAYVAGVVEGLAYSRFLRDKPEEEGMQCINSWFYGSGKNKWQAIENWFSRHPGQPASVLLYVLIKRECGE